MNFFLELASDLTGCNSNRINIGIPLVPFKVGVRGVVGLWSELELG